jgi:hypothetical protein
VVQFIFHSNSTTGEYLPLFRSYALRQGSTRRTFTAPRAVVVLRHTGRRRLNPGSLLLHTLQLCLQGLMESMEGSGLLGPSKKQRG